jgi:cytoskeleton protein RodZ
VAKRLRMNVRQIEALEAQRWQEFPGSAIVKGFLRSYAKVLNLNAEVVIASFSRANPESTVIPVASAVAAPLPRPGLNLEITKKMQSSFLLLLVLLAFLVWLLRGHWNDMNRWLSERDVLRAGSTAPAAAIESAAAPTTGGMDFAEAPVPVVPLSVSVLPVALPQDHAAVPSGASQAPASVSVKALVLKFSDESWVEILEADNTVLARGLQPADTVLNLEGEPPYRLLIGNAKRVSLSYQGREIDLSPYIGEKVARLTLE